MKRFAFLLLLVLGFLIWNQCQKNTSGIEQLATYTPLSVGDEWQMVSTIDSSTVAFKVTQKRTRLDGQEVFEVRAQVGNLPPDTLYFYLDDRFLINTTFYPLKKKLVPAFLEYRLAEHSPQEGDMWQPSNTDTITYITAHYQGHLNVYLGEVTKVYRFETNNPLASWALPVTYYAPNLGLVAAGERFGADEIHIEYLCSFKMVNGKKYGEPWPVKNPTKQLSDHYHTRYFIQRALGLD